MKLSIFDKKGKETKQIDAPKEIFGVRLNKDLLHQVVVSMKSNARPNVAHTKDRSEVSGGGKKPWRQKGLGRARHGSIRSPLWSGGGITFGPRKDKNYNRKINKKAQAGALAMVLSQKAQDGEIILIDSLKLESVKTKNAREILLALAKNKNLSDLAKKKNSSVIIALSEKNADVEKSFRNLKNVSLETIKGLNVIGLLNNKYLLIENPDSALKILGGRVVNGKK
ncbi:MAG TPA: 50S ribosomal protein L4 [Candidatus Paceibacterota bacterium]|nr:50S ribosomal protein L4 [Candidatus Paceibacterota bacterium]HRZ34288.1 50S ribosomal protein L4 [Candidatus Paceibacterota bacterium]